MFDSKIRSYIDPPLNAAGKRLAAKGITANMVTAAGFVSTLCAFACLYMQAYGGALFFVCLSRLMDGLDGSLARHSESGASDDGAFLDIVTDMIFYGGVVFFFAAGQPQTAMAAAFLIFSFMGSASSFLAYGIIAAKRDMQHDRQGKKSFYYAAGLCEGSETIFFFVLMCLLPAWFSVLAILFGLLCWITAAGRVALAMKNFK